MKTIITRNKYDFFEASSAMQKGIRRGEADIAGYFALELWESGYREYVWKRLFVISAEDCFGIITKEVEALYKASCLVSKGKQDNRGRIFVSKAVILLCQCRKSRDADHLQCIIYDQNQIENADRYFEEIRKNKIEIPDYAYDVHTLKGKRQGKTKEQFFQDEHLALKNRQTGFFDYLVEV